jgi:hypothetical protein
MPTGGLPSKADPHKRGGARCSPRRHPAVSRLPTCPPAPLRPSLTGAASLRRQGPSGPQWRCCACASGWHVADLRAVFVCSTTARPAPNLGVILGQSPGHIFLITFQTAGVINVPSSEVLPLARPNEGNSKPCSYTGIYMGGRGCQGIRKKERGVAPPVPECEARRDCRRQRGSGASWYLTK